MRRSFLLLFLTGFVTAVPARADEAEDKAKAQLAAQKKAAEANWALLEAGEFAHLETDHFLLYAPKAMDKKLKDTGTLLENQYKTAREVLKFPDKTEPWKGKATVYLFTERSQFAAYVRRVEKRRLESGEGALRVSTDNSIRVACGPPPNKYDWPAEAQAAAEVASLMLERKTGPATPLPDWLVSGFGRATYYRTLPMDALTAADRKQAAQLVAQKKKTAKDIWTGPLDADEAGVLSGALADFFAYGPGASRFGELLEAFKPDENMEMRTFEQAVAKTKGIEEKNIEPAWKKWVVNPK
jgi:hypothetical protein